MNITSHPASRLIFAAMIAFLGLGLQAAMARPVFNKPVYNPETKSYFELVEDRLTNGSQGPGWEGANQAAQVKYFKGVQGRLGIIPSAQAEMFIKTTLRPGYAWFGLVYDCDIRNLKLVTGEIVPKGSYANWDPVGWNLGSGGAFCPGNTGLMPAVLINGRYWGLQLMGKHYNEYLVEYPTGGVEPVKMPPKPAVSAPTPTGDTEKGSQNEE